MSSTESAARAENEVLTNSQPMEDNSASQEEEGVKMEWHLYQHEDGSGDWVVQGIDIDGEGEIFTTMFTDSDAEARARAYYDWQLSIDRKSIAA